MEKILKITILLVRFSFLLHMQINQISGLNKTLALVLLTYTKSDTSWLIYLSLHHANWLPALKTASWSRAAAQVPTILCTFQAE